MHIIRRKFLVKALKLFDLFVMSLCLYWVLNALIDQVAMLSLPHLLQTKVEIHDLILYIFMLIVWRITFTAFGLYRSRRFSAQKNEVADILKAITVASIIILIFRLLFFPDARYINRNLMAYFWILSNISTISYRIVLRYLLKIIRIRGRNLRRILIIGTNERAIQIAKKIIGAPELGYKVIGFVDDKWYADKNLLTSDYSIVASLKEIPDFIRKEVVDEIMLTIPVKSYYNVSSQIVSLCEEQGIIVRHVSNIYNLTKDRPWVEYIGDLPSIQLYRSNMDGWPAYIKRIIDVSVSSISLILLSPLFVAAAIVLKSVSPGPVFFIQDRVGLNKRIFRLYKFRTMFQDAEEKLDEIEHLNEATGPVFKIKQDPRITRVGKFLRKTSIDELPQLINVIKGDMSLVGPRPLPVRDYNGFNEDWHRRRFSVRPGVTCLWQINGRSEIPFEKWMELDMEYIDKWSLWLDIKILAKTIPIVLKGSGAA
jgi:exopolysaccharide biosynthesis polyprenyl glycosylphosphotransferase